MCFITLFTLVYDAAVVASVQRRRVGFILVSVPMVSRWQEFPTQPAGGATVAVQHVIQTGVRVGFRSITGLSNVLQQRKTPYIFQMMKTCQA